MECKICKAIWNVGTDTLCNQCRIEVDLLKKVRKIINETKSTAKTYSWDIEISRFFPQGYLGIKYRHHGHGGNYSRAYKATSIHVIKFPEYWETGSHTEWGTIGYTAGERSGKSNRFNDINNVIKDVKRRLKSLSKQYRRK